MVINSIQPLTESMKNEVNNIQDPKVKADVENLMTKISELFQVTQQYLENRGPTWNTSLWKKRINETSEEITYLFEKYYYGNK